jgi:hypothetical protein
MTTITLDTRKFVKTLQGAGVAAGQAGATATAGRDSHDAAELTKPDIRELELRMTSSAR